MSDLENRLRAAGLTVLSREGKTIRLAQDYVIEVENPDLFKLSHEGYVVAPFDDLEELVAFVLADME